MKRSYHFEWHKTNDKNRMIRNSIILINNATGNTSRDAKNALNLFIKNFGNLKKNTIIKIKEFGENGQIGEDIIPLDNQIVPVKK